MSEVVTPVGGPPGAPGEPGEPDAPVSPPVRAKVPLRGFARVKRLLFVLTVNVVLIVVGGVVVLLVAPLPGNFVALRHDTMVIDADGIPRMPPNLRDQPYLHGPGYGHIRMSTNAEGFRDVDHAIDAEPGVKRVVVIGDSFVFGLGVGDDATINRALERALEADRREGEPRWEAFNMGMPGLQLQGMGQMAQNLALKYRPDHIAYTYICDDISQTDVIPAWRWREELHSRVGFLPAAAREFVLGNVVVRYKEARYIFDYYSLQYVPGLYAERLAIVLRYLDDLSVRGGHDVSVITYCDLSVVTDGFAAFHASRPGSRLRRLPNPVGGAVTLDSTGHPTPEANAFLAGRLAERLRGREGAP